MRHSVYLAITSLTADDTESCKTVVVLDDLLSQSIHLCSVYKNARRQSSDTQFSGLRPLFDGNYKGQLTLIDALVDRIRFLGGSRSVFAGDFLHVTHCSHVLRGRKALVWLLRELSEAHESILIAARPSGSDGGHNWARDFAVGHVVLTNDLQSWSIKEHLANHDTRQVFLQMHVHAKGTHGDD